MYAKLSNEQLRALEYDGPYEGNRVLCRDCKHYNRTDRGDLHDYGTCAYIDERVTVSGSNNVCRQFSPRITHPNYRPFDFDEYLEYLFSDYYRPWGIDKDDVIGSAKLGEVVMDGGKWARIAPKAYSPFYQSYDRPYCRIVAPHTSARYGGRSFTLDYRLYRENRAIQDGEIRYKTMYWKETPRARKYKREVDGIYQIEGAII